MRKTALIAIIMISQCIFAQAQMVNLSVSHNPIETEITYVVDYIQLDSTLMWSITINLERSQIRQIKAKGTELVVKTRLLIILDGVPLCTHKEKKRLSSLNKGMVNSIEIINKKNAIELYGRKGKNGALLVMTKKN